MGRFICTALDLVVEYPVLLVLPLAFLSWLAYRLVHPDLLPGLPATRTLLLPNSDQSYPYAFTLSPLSYIRARLAFRSYARSRGYKSGSDFIKQLKEDEGYDWAGGEKPAQGDLVRGWDRVVVWDKDCIDMVVLESWRSLSDPLSDNALQATLQRGTTDVMLQIAQHKVDCTLNKATVPESSLLDFWDAVNQRPPPGCGAIGLDWYKEKGLLSDSEYEKAGYCEIDEEYSQFDSWRAKDDAEVEPTTSEGLVEEARILQSGKDMFYRYGPPIIVGLMHVGLSGGFASPRITDVLKATGYLMSAKRSSKDAHQQLHDNIKLIQEHLEKEKTESTLPSQATSERTFRRLLETMSFVLDVMESADSLSPPSMAKGSDVHAAKDGKALLEHGGDGWLSSCRVRFIHTNVRRRLSPAGNLSNVYSSSASGVPINQEDLLATLTSFSIAPLYTLQQMGISPSIQERKDYVALWRHVGFYMGIEPHLLKRVFRDVNSAERFFCCVASHHFLAVTKFKYLPSPPSISSSFGKDLEEVKKFHFDQGPALPLLYSVAKRPPGNMSFSTLCCLSRFLLGNALANAVSLPSMTRRQYLGIRLRLFILAFPPLFARYYPRRQFGIDLRENCRGLLRRVIIWSLKGDRVSFESNRDENKGKEAKIDIGVEEGVRLRRQYFHLMYEMLAVSTLLALFTLAGLWFVLASTVQLFNTLQRNHCIISTSS